ncbi:MAG: class I SAM-dependent methyltransferase [archaeon GB-1867-035]|nr:class I SAM-dependent methyltransferase [Candidatus Culexmicrobium profundum]
MKYKWNKETLEYFYKHFRQIYDISTPGGLKRIDQTRETIKETLSSLNLQLSEKNRVLVLCSGSGPEAIALAELYNCSITCIEIQDWLLQKCLDEARKRKLKIEGISLDVRQINKIFSENEFDAIFLWGSSLAHFNIFDFDDIASKAYRILKRNGFFVIEQADHVFGLLMKYKDIILEDEESLIISIHAGFDPHEGCWKRVTFNLKDGSVNSYLAYVWSPWIIRYVLYKNNFNNIKIIRKMRTNTHVVVGFKI